MQARKNLFELKGGDTIQILKTKEYLEKKGIEVDLKVDLELDVSEYDIIHLFNLTRVQETYFQVTNAKKYNKPIVLSTIYWETEEFEKNGQIGIRKLVNNMLSINKIESIKAAFKYFFKGEKDEGTKYLIKNNFTDIQREILKSVDWFLPNSQLEMACIEKNLNFKTDNYTVVPNAIDQNLNLKAFSEKYDKYSGYVLCVGRIETRKNQLNLLRALIGTNYKVLLVGEISPGHRKYGAKVMKLVNENDNFEYIESIKNEELYNLYAKCKVHVLASWFETPGLVSLEAASQGCNIVVTDRGTTKDYFKNYVFYCQPNELVSIKNAVDKAYNSKQNDELISFIKKNYVWDKAANETIKGYKNLIEKNNLN